MWTSRRRPHPAVPSARSSVLLRRVRPALLRALSCLVTGAVWQNWARQPVRLVSPADDAVEFVLTCFLWVGEALVEVVKTIPLVAPVAFLICAVASSAASAVVLKNDCMEFVRVLNSVEQILMQAQNLHQANAAINDVRDILEEALALMDAVQNRGWLTSTFLAKAEKNRFEQIKIQLQEALGRLNLASTVEMGALQQARFDQMEQMKARLDELGGPEAVLSDPAARQEMEQSMQASERLVLAAVEKSRQELVTVGSDVQLTRKKTMQIAREQKQQSLMADKSFKLQLAQDEKLDRQDEKLDQMTESFIQMQKETELAKLQAEIMKRQLDEMKGMLRDVKGYFEKFPTPPQEPERMLVMNHGGFMHLQPQTPAFETLQDICRAATRRWGVGSNVNMIGHLKQASVAGCFPKASDAATPGAFALGDAAAQPAAANASQGEEVCVFAAAADMHGFSAPRKFSVCQHVTARSKPLLLDGVDDIMQQGFATPEDWGVAAKHDAEMGKLIGVLPSIANHTSAAELVPDPATVMQPVLMDGGASQAQSDWMVSVFTSPSMFYSGVPVIVEVRCCWCQSCAIRASMVFLALPPGWAWPEGVTHQAHTALAASGADNGVILSVGATATLKL